MGYDLNLASLRILTTIVTKSVANWINVITQVRQSAAYIAESNIMAGEGANNLISYLECVHLNSICGALSTTLATLEAICREYYSAYIAQVSDKCDEVINTDELEDIQRALKDIRYRVYQVESDMKSVMHSISGATKQSYRGLGIQIPAEFEKAITQLGDLVNTIGEIETASTSGLAGIEASISAIRQIIYASCSKEASITAFSANEFLSGQGFTTLLAAMETVAAQYTDIQSRSAEIDALLAGVEQQWEQRETIATVAKIGLAILETAVIAVAAVTLTPVGAACVGAAIGAINGAVSEASDQWASGEMAIQGGFDFNSILYEGVKGGAKGGLSAGMGAAFAPLKAVASPLGKAGLQFTSSFAGELLDAPFELLETAAEEGFDVAWERVTSNEYAVEMVAKCSANAAVGTVVDDYIGKATDALPAASSAFEHHLDKFVTSGIENVVTSKVEAVVDTAVEAFVPDDDRMTEEVTITSWERRESYGKRIVNEVVPSALETLLDGSDIAKDFIQGGVADAAPGVFKESHLYRDRVNDAIQRDSRLQGASGSKYRSYMQSYAGEHIAFDNSADPVEVLLLDSDPDLSAMKDITSYYSAPMKTVSKAASKLWTHETHDEEQEPLTHFFGFDFSMRPIGYHSGRI